VVPVDYVADAVFELSRDPVDRCRTYNLVAGSQATTVGRLIELSADRLGGREPTVIPPPVFKTLVYPVLRRGSTGRGLERSSVFFPYFSMDCRYRNDRARERLEPSGITAPPIESYFDRLLNFAQKAEWGRRPVTRAQAAGAVPTPT
jgi:hypothetical protein